MEQKPARGGLTAKVLTGQILFATTILIHLGAIRLSTKVSFFPETATLHTIVATCAQIIAGLYGITAAGYTFFQSRIDALSSQDVTLDHIISSLKNRFKYIMWCTTANVLVTLVVSVALLYCPAPTDADHAFYYRLFCNEFLVSLGCSIVLILGCSLKMVDPNAIGREARKLKRRISRSLLPTGDVGRFIELYDAIVNLCCARVSPRVLARLRESKGKRFEYVIELLLLGKQLPAPILLDVRRIHQYYECCVNCSPMTVTREMVELAQRTLDRLESMLAVPKN